MIEKAEAIVLRSKKYGDTSKIITLYTKEFGKISVIAKGSRSRNNKFGGSLEPISHISIVFYKYANRDLQYISQSSIIDFFPSVHNDFSKMMIVIAILEIVNNVIHSEEQNKDFFNLILNTIRSIEKSDSNYNRFLLYFQVHLANIFGFQPNFNLCEICSKEFDNGYVIEENGFIIDRGCLICRHCLEKSIFPHVKIALPSIQILQKLTDHDISIINDIPISRDALLEIYNLMHQYLMHHITGMRNLKSIEVFSKFR
jgi:DNA repair protein RecO (recombination protein O)